MQVTPQMRRALAFAGVLVLIAYPLLVYAGLTRFEPRFIVLLLPLALVVSLRSGSQSPFKMAGAWMLVPIGALLLTTLFFNHEWLLRLYPVVMSLSLAGAFAHSLRHPPSLIEQLARLKTPQLSAEGIHYCTQVTRVWIIYLMVNAGIALYTALFASREIWTLYNGFISYLCMGVLFGAEWLVRRRVQRRVHGPAGLQP
jgi:uncharacterized membrane protein